MHAGHLKKSYLLQRKKQPYVLVLLISMDILLQCRQLICHWMWLSVHKASLQHGVMMKSWACKCWTIHHMSALQIGSDVDSGSIDGQGDHGTDSSMLDAISSLKAVSDSSEVQAEAELIAPASLEASAGPADLRSAPGQGTSQPPAELLFGTASGILAPSATFQPPASPSTLPSPSVKTPTPVPVNPTPGVPTPTPPAQPLPIANAWRKPLQGTSAVDKAAADVPLAQDAQAPRAAAEAATVDQASVAAVTGAVPADSGRAGRGRGRGGRGRDREALSSDNIERPGAFCPQPRACWLFEEDSVSAAA